MTNHYADMKNASAFLVFCNQAENHPGCTQYINEARAKGAKMLVVDPRRTRTGAMADQYMRIRPGTDIAFINGVIKRHLDRVDADGRTAADTTPIPAGPGSYMRRIDNWATNTSSSHWFAENTIDLNLKWPYWTDSLFRTNEGYPIKTGLTIDSSTTTNVTDTDLYAYANYLPDTVLRFTSDGTIVTVTDYNATTKTVTFTPALAVAPTGNYDILVAPGKSNDYLRYGRDVNALTGKRVDIPAKDSKEADSDPNKSQLQADVNGSGTFANDNYLPVLGHDLNAGAKDVGSKTVYEVTKSRVAAYDSATVSGICGFGVKEFENLADTFMDNSWAYTHGSTAIDYKAATILYAMGTTQHTHGSANVKVFANLQTMLGNMGKHGGGVNALRGIGNVQGSTDQSLLYHLLMAYVAVPMKYKIVEVDTATRIRVSSKPEVNSTIPQVISRVILGNANGFKASNAATYTVGTVPNDIAGCGTAITSVTEDSSNPGTYWVVTANSLTASGLPAVGDTLFSDYESWLFQKSFGGRTVYPSGGANAVYPGGWTFTGGIPWGHQGMWAVTRTFFSDGLAGGAVLNTPAQASSAVNDHYNRYMPKGNGYDHVTMVKQTGNGEISVGNPDGTPGYPNKMPGYDKTKTQIKGMLVWGMNPRVAVCNSTNAEEALENLDWLAVVDMFKTETANAPRKLNAPTYLLPAASFAETAGTTSNSGRWIQWRHQAVEPIADCMTDMEILFKLANAMHKGYETTDGTNNWMSSFDYATGAAAYNALWRDQYAGYSSTAGILAGTNGAALAAKPSLADPATAWDNDDYRASYQSEDGLGYSGYAERVMIQTSTASNDKYGNAGTNWLQGSKPGGGGTYGAWHDPAGNHLYWNTAKLPVAGYSPLTDSPPQYSIISGTTPADTVWTSGYLWNRTQDRNPNDVGGKGLFQAFSWVWLRNRRIFYNKGGFCPADVVDIYVAPDEVATTFVSVPGYSKRPAVASYTGAWRGARSMTDIPINSADRTWSKLGYTPVHWEPHETVRPDLAAAYGQIGTVATEDWANTDAERLEFEFTMTTFRHTEHYQGGPMSRNLPWLNELVPAATVEINSYDAARLGIQDGAEVYLSSKRAVNIGPWIARVSSGLLSNQRVGKGLLAVPWHWGSEGLSTGPTANDLTTDARDANTNMPESKVCLVKIASFTNPS